jgi:molybdenum cofactor cytidylyltransferase
MTRSPSSDPFVTVVVLAAGGSSRFGRPRPLLPYRGRTLLDATLSTARSVGADQVVVALGGAADAVRRRVDLRGCDVASSLAAAVDAVDERCDVLVVLLGDQPGVRAESVGALLDGRGDAPLAVCRYCDGRGHPLAFSRETFGDLAARHGDKGVWRLLDERQAEVAEVAVHGPVPRDVDTWSDYEAVFAS